MIATASFAVLLLACVARPGIALAEDKPPPLSLDSGRPPPLNGDSPIARYPRERHVDLGASFVFISPVSNSLEDEPPRLRYRPGPGASAYARVVILPWLQASFVFSWAAHPLDIDDQALGVSGPFEAGEMTSYRLEAHALPTLPLGDRARIFAILGLGWGRLEVGPMYAHDAAGRFLIRGRGASYFDVPAGLGASVELIRGWLGLDLALWGAPTFAKDGTAHTPLSAIDASGKPQTVGPLPETPVWFVQSLGVSLLL